MVVEFDSSAPAVEDAAAGRFVLDAPPLVPERLSLDCDGLLDVVVETCVIVDDGAGGPSRL
jgi:hypothetical protein